MHSHGKAVIFVSLAVDVEMNGGYLYVDFDDDSPVHPHASFKGSDFWFEVRGKKRFFNPQHGAMLALGSDSKTGYEGCSEAKYAKGRFRIDTLPMDASICVLSDEGRFAQVQIGKFDPKTTALSLAWTSWEKEPSAAGGKQQR